MREYQERKSGSRAKFRVILARNSIYSDRKPELKTIEFTTSPSEEVVIYHMFIQQKEKLEIERKKVYIRPPIRATSAPIH